MGLGLGLGLVCSSAFSTGMEEPTVVGGTAVSLTSPSPDVVSVSADSSAVGSGMLVNLSSDVEAAGAVASVFSASPEGLQNKSFNILSYPDPILVQLTTMVLFFSMYSRVIVSAISTCSLPPCTHSFSNRFFLYLYFYM